MRTAFALLALALPAAAAPVDPDSDASDLVRSVRRLTEALHAIETHSADPVDPSAAIYRGAIPAMMRTLDPHSAFLDPEQFESLQEMQRSTEKGFGSVVSLNHGRVVVLQTLPESPSMRAGLASGDEIVAINGYRVAALTIDQLVALLSQSRRQKAELMVQRPNFPRPISMTLTPAELADPSVRHPFLLEPGIGYLKVANFESDTDQELRAAIDKLGGDKLKGLVIDLRKNPGGIIESSVRVAAMFLEPGSRVLWIRGREGPQEEVRVPTGNQPYRFPLALLVDEETASASELVAGALQDNDRATILGSRTFGKGLVQSVFPLSEKTGLALTTALYLSPSGRAIQRPIDRCKDYQLGACAQDGPPPSFPTASGREIPGGGGIEPDRRTYARGYTRFEAWMKASDAFLDFAQEYVRSNGATVDEAFEVSPQILDRFQSYLGERGARVTLAEWTATVEFVRRNLKQEILNLTLGVDRGDEVELRNDPQVLAAKRALLEAR